MASHVVGNVYFHAIAVGSQSHYALRASNYNKLGSAASAGCIRMTVADAKWLYDYAAVAVQLKLKKEILKNRTSRKSCYDKNSRVNKL